MQCVHYLLKFVIITIRKYFCNVMTYKYTTRASQRDVKNHSLWMFMDAADSLFVVRFLLSGKTESLFLQNIYESKFLKLLAIAVCSSQNIDESRLQDGRP